MISYWLRNRLPLTVAFVVVMILIIGLVFVSPYIQNKASEYNTYSLYRNTKIDFIVPAPSFAQVDELSGTHGIGRIFPYYITKTDVSVKGRTRSSQVLLSDHHENVDFTMYNDVRLIQQSSMAYDNPIYIDWQFCRDVSASIGDELSISLGDRTIKYIIAAIYETNSIHDGGTILAPISVAERDAIAQDAKNKGYSGMYISASNYLECREYLTTDYRPLGRLKERSLFESDDSYNIHYHAIMDAGFANEITDFRMKENSLNIERYNSLLLIGAGFVFVLFMAFGLIMSMRGSEQGYFIKHAIPGGRDVKSYYAFSFVSEVVLFIALYYLAIEFMRHAQNQYIPEGIIDGEFMIIPLASVIAEIISLLFIWRKLRSGSLPMTNNR